MSHLAGGREAATQEIEHDIGLLVGQTYLGRRDDGQLDSLPLYIPSPVDGRQVRSGWESDRCGICNRHPEDAMPRSCRSMRSRDTAMQALKLFRNDPFGRQRRLIVPVLREKLVKPLSAVAGFDGIREEFATPCRPPVQGIKRFEKMRFGDLASFVFRLVRDRKSTRL